MATINREIWIEKGYEMFANYGLNGLKVEPLAIKVGKSKSSFYHYFADLELFQEFLLIYHLDQSKTIAHKEQKANNIEPELINILLEHHTDLLFNRQLRINKNIPSFAATLEESTKIIGDAFVEVWTKDLGLQLSKQQIESIYSLALENFFLQINIETLNYEWLSNYFSELKEIAQQFSS